MDAGCLGRACAQASHARRTVADLRIKHDAGVFCHGVFLSCFQFGLYREETHHRMQNAVLFPALLMPKSNVIGRSGMCWRLPMPLKFSIQRSVIMDEAQINERECDATGPIST